jgi:hypothetical protein
LCRRQRRQHKRRSKKSESLTTNPRNGSFAVHPRDGFGQNVFNFLSLEPDGLRGELNDFFECRFSFGARVRQVSRFGIKTIAPPGAPAHLRVQVRDVPLGAFNEVVFAARNSRHPVVNHESLNRALGNFKHLHDFVDIDDFRFYFFRFAELRI